MCVCTFKFTLSVHVFVHSCAYICINIYTHAYSCIQVTTHIHRHISCIINIQVRKHIKYTHVC